MGSPLYSRSLLLPQAQLSLTSHRENRHWIKFIFTAVASSFVTILKVALCIFGFLFVFNKFILFLAALGLRCCARAFSSCGKRGLLSVAECGLLVAVAFLVVEHGL